jgi:hypothetical protein
LEAFWDIEGIGQIDLEAGVDEYLIQFPDPGTYLVTLIVTDTVCNFSDTSSAAITSSQPPGIISSELNVDCETLTASFTAAFNTNPDQLIYLWDVGDGTIYAEDTVLHVYDAPGEYVVQFTFLDTVCLVDSSFTDTLFFRDGVAADFFQIPECTDSSVTLFYLGTALGEPNLDATWNITGLGQIELETGVLEYEFQLPDTGAFTVTLQVSDPLCNFNESLTLTDVIKPSIAADFLLRCLADVPR